MRLEPRPEIPLLLALCAPLIAISGALVFAGLLIRLSGADPIEALRLTLAGAFGSRLSLTETLVRTTPLIFTGLAAAVAFRARVWNIGAEGQFYAGALATAAIGHASLDFLPPAIAIPVLMLIGAAAGALLLAGPVLLRLYSGADEVVTTLLLNFVVLLFVSAMIEGPLRDEMAFGWPQSETVNSEFTLPILLSRTRLHLGIGVAILAAFLVWIVQTRTVFGMQVRAAGLNPRAAAFAGVSLPRSLLAVACLSGGLAGLAGCVEVLGVKGYVTTDLSPGYGYSGIVIAMIAGLHPLGVIGGALFVALTFVGADGMSRALHVPSFISDVVVSSALMMMLVTLLFTTHRIRR